PAPGDARRLALLPTREGLKLRERAPAPAQDRLIAALASLSASEQRRLADALDRLVRALGPDERTEPMLFTEEPPTRPRRRAKRANKRA
ncbi:MAG TPA: MarR family transcriptional regulator, partial [Polyangia bacterium]